MTRPTLVYLYGPPASGKLTIAEQMAATSELRLFHNHLTVNALTAVFEFGSAPFSDVLHRLRLDVLETAAGAGIGLIFTNNSAWRGHDGRQRFAAFADEAAGRYASKGGSTLFVRVSAPIEVLEQRIDNESRRRHRKLLDVGGLRELVTAIDLSPLHPDDLCIDTSTVEPAEAARLVLESVRRLG